MVNHIDMEQTVREITRRLIKQLPAGKEFYTREDLQNSELPDFVVQRVLVEMNKNLNDSVRFPSTEWADVSDGEVQIAWQRTLEVLGNTLRMPAPFAGALLETAVNDLLEMTTRPREVLPAVLFGSDKVLRREQLTERARTIPVHGHLASALLRYMEKKEKEELSLQECKTVIATIDQKLTMYYTPEKWAEAVDPVFILTGASADASLFRIFFEDKEENRLAHLFERHDTLLDREKFIKVLSSPIEDLFDDVENEDDDHRAAEPEDFRASIPPVKPVFKQEPEPEEAQKTDLFRTRDEKEKRTGTDEETTVSPGIFEETVEEKDPAKEKESIVSLFYKDKGEEEEETDVQARQEEEQDSSLADEFSEEEPPQYSEEKTVQLPDETGNTKERNDRPWIGHYHEEPDDEKEVEEDESDDIPVWKAFLGSEEDAEEENYRDTETGLPGYRPAQKEDAGLSGSAGDPHQNDHWPEESFEPLSAEGKMDKLVDWLAPGEKRFMMELFNGSNIAYKRALSGISNCEDWRQASKYIETEIFSRSNVDLYNKVAIDFIDQLHSFFREVRA